MLLGDMLSIMKGMCASSLGDWNLVE